MERTGVVVVGAGAIGLAIAMALAREGREVVVLEKAETFGTHTSSRSNEVIHAGLYHRPGGPQAVLCTRGREALYAFCARHGVPHRQVGKYVVATAEEHVPWLEGVFQTARGNGVPGLEMLSGETARRAEPNLSCAAAMHSPRSGIVDTHLLMVAFIGEAEDQGAAIAYNTEVTAIRPESDGFTVEVALGGGERFRLGCSAVVNAAGLWAPGVARAVEGFPPELAPDIHFAWGAFFACGGRAPFSRLIIPEPVNWRQGGIFTLDLAGRGKFGPDEHWVDAVDYAMPAEAGAHAYAAVRSYFPALPDGALTPDYAGIRPRLNGPGEPGADWLFQGPEQHGVPGLVNLFGFESPGITAALPIAEAVAGMLRGEPLPFEVDPRKHGRFTPPEARRDPGG
jgi:L-2-hydroxyglutarate oxidase LhgO